MTRSPLSCRTEHAGGWIFHRTQSMLQVLWVSIHNEFEWGPRRALLRDRFLLLMTRVLLANCMIHVIDWDCLAWFVLLWDKICYLTLLDVSAIFGFWFFLWYFMHRFQMTVEFLVSLFSSKDISITSRKYSWSGISAKIGIPSSPNFAGSGNSFLLIVEQCIRPVTAGMNSAVITLSSWFSWSEMSGMVFMIYDSLCFECCYEGRVCGLRFCFCDHRQNLYFV